MPDAVDILTLIQDAPVAGTPFCARFLAQLARKIETPGTASRLRELIELGGATVEDQ